MSTVFFKLRPMQSYDRYGRPIARTGPAIHGVERGRRLRAIKALRDARAGTRLRGLSIDELRRDGRR